MKKTKQLLAFLLVAILIATLTPLALGATYTTVSPSVSGTLGLKEELEVTQTGAQNPAVTYTLTLGTITAYSSGGITYGDTAKVTNTANVNGKVLGTVSFATGEVTGVKTVSKDYNVTSTMIDAINDLVFDRPGIYYWPITKTYDTADTKLTNHNRSASSNNGTALLIRVDDVSGTLETTVGINVLESGIPGSNKNPVYKDNYPAIPGTLTLEKNVTGNQGAKDQYFKFTVTLTGMTSHAGGKITVAAHNSVLTSTMKYGEDITGNSNGVTELTIDANGKAEGIFWLKDDELVTLSNIPIGSTDTQWQIKEEANDGYTVRYTTQIGSVGTTEDSSDTGVNPLSKTDTTRIVFRNDKASTVPTGIILQVAAPVAGIVLALALLAVVMLSKKRSAARR